MNRNERASGRHANPVGSRPDHKPIKKDSPLSRWPVNLAKNKITSQYDANRNLKVGTKVHKGLDIAPLGTKKRDLNVYAAGDGVVFQVGHQDDTGLMVKIYHKDGNITTRYLHLDSAIVKVGQSVRAGEIIGKMGSTGHSTATHLHFDVLEGKQEAGSPRHYLNPNDFLPSPKPPVDSNTMPNPIQHLWR